MCDVRVASGGAAAGAAAGAATDDDAPALLLVMSRIGFLKAMKVAPAVAVKLLWNLATGLSTKFMRSRNAARALRATLLELEDGAAAAGGAAGDAAGDAAEPGVS